VHHVRYSVRQRTQSAWLAGACGPPTLFDIAGKAHSPTMSENEQACPVLTMPNRIASPVAGTSAPVAALGSRRQKLKI